MQVDAKSTGRAMPNLMRRHKGKLHYVRVKPYAGKMDKGRKVGGSMRQFEDFEKQLKEIKALEKLRIEDLKANQKYLEDFTLGTLHSEKPADHLSIERVIPEHYNIKLSYSSAMNTQECVSGAALSLWFAISLTGPSVHHRSRRFVSAQDGSPSSSQTRSKLSAAR